MTIGEQLKKARIERQLSTSQVAAATRMKVQTVEDLEADDFSRMAAPIYAKGFIKMYATHVGLKPDTLIREYMRRYVEGRSAAQLAAAEEPAPPDATPTGPVAPEPDLFARAGDEPEAEAAPAEPRRSPGETVDAMRAAVARSRDRVCDTCARALGAARERIAGAIAACRARKLTLPHVQFSEAPVKSASVIVGIVLILILLLSTLSRCMPRSDRAHAPAPAGEDGSTLRLAVELPPPYVD